MSLTISQQIEDLLTARNPRGMQTLQAALEPRLLLSRRTDAHKHESSAGHVLIGTGFPVEPAPTRPMAQWVQSPCTEPLESLVQADISVRRTTGRCR